MLRKIAFSACAFAVLACSWGSAAYAQGPVDRRTFFTFSQPVQIPGVTLPAGKYVFRLADDTSSRRVIQVLDDNAMTSYAMFLTIPAERQDISSKPEVQFMETPEGTTPAIQTWWYPGMRTGYELVYPREQALRLATASRQPVLTTTTASVSLEEMTTADLSRVVPDEQIE